MIINFEGFYTLLNKSFWDFFENKDRVRISYGGSGSGKCLKNGTKIIMYSGKLKNIENVKVGDVLMGIDSTPRKVLETHSGKSDLYIVKQNKGIDYIVNENHILTLKKSSFCKKDKGELFPSGNYRRPNGRYPYEPSIKNISILKYIKKSNRWKKIFFGYRSKIEFEEKKIEIDPYFLGLWLGDGSSHRINLTTIDDEIKDYIHFYKNELNNIYDKPILLRELGKKGTHAKDYFLTYGNTGQKSISPLLEIFRKYNLIKNKHIPDDYLYNTREVRLQLLAGLIDTDGSLQGNCYDLIQKDKKLSYQIKYLCNSLGFRCEIKECRKSCKVKNNIFTGIYYRMNINGDVQSIPVKIKRKKIINFNKNKDTYTTGINVEYYGYGEYTGISLDGDNLFMLEDCTVVHNSFSAFQEILYKIIAEPGHNYLICRKVAATNKTSTYALLIQLINQLNLTSLFKINKTDMSLTVKSTGYMIVLKGLDDIEKIKSFTFPQGILTDIVIEEASETTQKDFDQLNARLRGIRMGKQKNIPFQITMLLNPIIDTHWIKREFIDKKSYQKSFSVFILKTTYLDNEFIDEDYKEVLEGYKDIDFEFYRVYCLGEWGSFGNIIFNNWSFESCPYTEDDFDAIYNGQDFGFTHPQVIVKIGFKDGVMYTYNELCAFEKTNKEIIDMNKEFDILHDGETIICDSAEPSKIKEWLQHGYGAKGAVKGKDSVTRGIDFLKSQKWIIDDTKCPRTAQEVQIYHWKEDKDGNSTDKPVDIMDDSVKAHMYGLEPLSRMKGKPSVLSGSKSDQKKDLITAKKEERKKRREILKAQRKKNKENK